MTEQNNIQEILIGLFAANVAYLENDALAYTVPTTVSDLFCERPQDLIAYGITDLSLSFADALVRFSRESIFTKYLHEDLFAQDYLFNPADPKESAFWNVFEFFGAPATEWYDCCEFSFELAGFLFNIPADKNSSLPYAQQIQDWLDNQDPDTVEEFFGAFAAVDKAVYDYLSFHFFELLSEDTAATIIMAAADYLEEEVTPTQLLERIQLWTTPASVA